MRSWTRRIFSGLAALAILGFGALVWHRLGLLRQSESEQRPLPLVQISTPLQLTMERKLLLTADVLPLQQAELMAKVAGYLDAIYVDRGDRVHAGQLLAIIREPELEHQLQRAQTNHDLAKITFERLEALFAQGLIAKQELDDAHSRFSITKRELELQQTYAEYAKIVAPFDGYVTRRHVDPGALIPQVSSGSSSANILLTVMDISRVKVMINVPERDIASVHVGDAVSLTVDAYPDQTFRGQVSRFGPALDRGSRTLLVEVDVANDDLALKPGMFARVLLILERRPDVLAVPSEALLVNELGSYLYVVNAATDGAAESTVRKVAVSTGVEDGGQVEILAGLAPSSRIVRSGKELLHDGSVVRVAADGNSPRIATEH
jgi:membrane fusion protein (multidrug efflux system)